MAWHFGLCDLAGVPIGEVQNASERNLSLRLNHLNTARFEIALDNPLASAITDLAGDCLLKIYQDSTLRGVYDLTLIEEVGAGYRRVIDRGGLLNDAYSLNGGYPDSPDVRSAADAASQTARGLFQEVIASDIVDTSLRQALVDAHVAVRKQAKQEVTFEPSATEAGSLVVNAADPLWRLAKRLLGISYDGLAYEPTAAAANTLVSNVLTYVNGWTDTGIRLGTFDTFYTTKIGPYHFKPASEFLTEFQEAKVAFPFETPPSYTQLDRFPGSGNINGRTDGTGFTWTTSGPFGTGLDWVIIGGPTDAGSAFRESYSETAGGLKASSNVTPQTTGIWGADYEVSVSSEGAPIDLHLALFCRNDEAANEWLRAGIYFGTTPPALGQINLHKRVAGTETLLGSVNFTSPFPILADTRYSIRVFLDTAGNYMVWHYQTSIGPTEAPQIRGTDSALATGGALASGGIAFWDSNLTATAHRRYWDNVFIAPYLGPASFDFEIAPSEPTADTNQSGVNGAGLKIGTLNMRSRIGSSKPNAVFDFGSGAPLPAYGTDYVVGDTVTARAIAAGTERFNESIPDGGGMRVYGIDLSIDGEGKEDLKPLMIPE